MPLTAAPLAATLAQVPEQLGVVGHVQTRRGRIVASLLVVLLAGGLVGACSPVASKGTMPTPGPNGQIDTASAPDFIAIAGHDGGIAGYARKADVLATDPAPFPVFADDLRTVVGQMVPDKGVHPGRGRPPDRAEATGPGSRVE